MRRRRLQNLYEKTLLQNKNVFSIFIIMLNTLGSNTAMQVVRLDYMKTIRTTQQDFLYGGFVQVFTVHLLKKNSRLYHLHKPRYMQNTKCRKTFAPPGNTCSENHSVSLSLLFENYGNEEEVMKLSKILVHDLEIML